MARRSVCPPFPPHGFAEREKPTRAVVRVSNDRFFISETKNASTPTCVSLLLLLKNNSLDIAVGRFVSRVHFPVGRYVMNNYDSNTACTHVSCRPTISRRRNDARVPRSLKPGLTATTTTNRNSKASRHDHDRDEDRRRRGPALTGPKSPPEPKSPTE